MSAGFFERTHTTPISITGFAGFLLLALPPRCVFLPAGVLDALLAARSRPLISSSTAASPSSSFASSKVTSRRRRVDDDDDEAAADDDEELTTSPS